MLRRESSLLKWELKQPNCDNAESKIVDQFVPISPELINDCKNQNSMTENEMDF